MITFDLSGKTALITGAGRGIGRAIASRLAEGGANVVLNDLDADAANEAASTLARATAVPGDVTAAEFPGHFVQTAISAYGGIDVIVNNAGYTWDSVIQKTTDEQFQAMLDIHITAPFRILRAASEYIRAAAKSEAASGQRTMRKVVNITSIAGTDGNAGQAGYSSGKAGVIGPTTGAGASIDIKGRAISVGVQPRVLETIKSICPLGRLGTPEEAADTVLFFCSPLSDYVTGEVLICGGGLHF
jgi:3-oxoacyl-[acyl-carrier protein] reductase